MNQYPEIAISGSQVNAQISAYPDTRSIVIYNESPYFLRVSLTGSGTYGLAAYTADCFQVFSGFTGGIVFYPTQYIAINSGTTVPASVIFIQAYGQNESLSRLIQANSATGYPISLSRLQNIGNGSQVAGQASSIVNDGNVAGTSIIESTVQGDTGSAVSLSNDGVLKIGTNAHHGSVSFDNGAFTSDGSGNITANNATGATLTLEKAGTEYLQLLDNANGASVDVPAGNNLTLSINGISVAFANHTNNKLSTPQGINLTAGGISHMNGGIATLSGQSATVAHGLGITPNAVICTPILAQPGSATVGVGNVNSSTFEVTCGSGSQVYWLAWNI